MKKPSTLPPPRELKVRLSVTLSPGIGNWLTKYSHETKATVSGCIEAALLDWKRGLGK